MSAPDLLDLSHRESQIAHLVAEGHRTAEIAKYLGLSAHTIKSHLKSAFVRLGVRNRVELTRLVLGKEIPPRLPGVAALAASPEE